MRKKDNLERIIYGGCPTEGCDTNVPFVYTDIYEQQEKSREKFYTCQRCEKTYSYRHILRYNNNIVRTLK